MKSGGWLIVWLTDVWTLDPPTQAWTVAVDLDSCVHKSWGHAAWLRLKVESQPAVTSAAVVSMLLFFLTVIDMTVSEPCLRMERWEGLITSAGMTHYVFPPHSQSFSASIQRPREPREGICPSCRQGRFTNVGWPKDIVWTFYHWAVLDVGTGKSWSLPSSCLIISWTLWCVFTSLGLLFWFYGSI